MTYEAAEDWLRDVEAIVTFRKGHVTIVWLGADDEPWIADGASLQESVGSAMKLQVLSGSYEKAGT